MNEGRVFLVGAGPGDPGLLTVRGRSVLESAQAVVYDRLVAPGILELVPAGAEQWNVGKLPGGPSWKQEDINALLLRLAQEGKKVARLKGGDPLLLGRGGEEALALAGAGIPWEVVPGITSALAGPAYAGIPVTHRGRAHAVEVISAHREDPGDGSHRETPQFPPPRGQTLIILMGVGAIESWSRQLQDLGWEGSTPVALVEWGTWPEQRVLETTLERVKAMARSREWSSPSVAVVGQVAQLREKMAWLQHRPLWGCRVLVTRPRDQAQGMQELIREMGGEASSLPTLEIAPAPAGELDRTLAELPRAQWVVFTSANAVHALLRHLAQKGGDSRQLAGKGIFALGPGTGQALESWGLRPDAFPAEYRTRAVSEFFSGRPPSALLLPRSDRGDRDLPRELKASGHLVQETSVYRAVTPKPDNIPHLSSLLGYAWHYLTFTSPSTVEGALELLGENRLRHWVEAEGTRVAAIGPVTAQKAREHGLPAQVVPARYTVEDLVEAIRQDWAPADAGNEAPR